MENFKSVTLSRERLAGLLEETIEWMIEIRDHGEPEGVATKLAVDQTLNDMDEAVGLIDSGETASPHEKYHIVEPQHVTVNPFHVQRILSELDKAYEKLATKRREIEKKLEKMS